MSKAVMLSINPKWCELIAIGKKTVEVRKTKPKLDTPFKCYIYCTQGEALAYPNLNNPKFHFMRTNNGTSFGRKMTVSERNESDYTFGNGKVIGEFVCNKIDRIGRRGVNNNFDYCYLSLDAFGNDDIEIEITGIKKSYIKKEELNAYAANSKELYAWHISDLMIYDKPKELGEFKKLCRYRNYDGSCQYDKIECDCAKFDFNPDYSVNLAECCDYMFKPPQSWCYVEELKNGK